MFNVDVYEIIKIEIQTIILDSGVKPTNTHTHTITRYLVGDIRSSRFSFHFFFHILVSPNNTHTHYLSYPFTFYKPQYIEKKKPTYTTPHIS